MNVQTDRQAAGRAMLAEAREKQVQARELIFGDPKPRATADLHVEACACGEQVTPQRATDSWLFYCGRCGADWNRPAERQPRAPRRVPRKRCKCDRECRFCHGDRRAR